MKKLRTSKNLRAEYKILLDSNDTVSMKSFIQTHGISEDNIDLILSDELSDDDLDGVVGGVALSSSPDKDEVVFIDNKMLCF
ncbi:MAG: hypothetical protein U9O56_10445 [Campylobacterota bacterium]|nr:hypothetical protein [Campylobacterota bacterium]